ncbi:MAG: hypothetical protein MHPSP_004400, partial [Paramarteilia canceri]
EVVTMKNENDYLNIQNDTIKYENLTDNFNYEEDYEGDTLKDKIVPYKMKTVGNTLNDTEINNAESNPSNIVSTGDDIAVEDYNAELIDESDSYAILDIASSTAYNELIYDDQDEDVNFNPSTNEDISIESETLEEIENNNLEEILDSSI